MSDVPTFFPLFFDQQVLTEFTKVDKATRYLGKITTKTSIIAFGISPKGFVTVWLRDFFELSSDDRGKFIKYLVMPDRLGQHFKKTQMDAEFVDDSDPN
ncbi:MAG: hypothetical protein ACREBU_21810 [Nitrososphaera sp.]